MCSRSLEKKKENVKTTKDPLILQHLIESKVRTVPGLYIQPQFLPFDKVFRERSHSSDYLVIQSFGDCIGEPKIIHLIPGQFLSGPIVANSKKEYSAPKKNANHNIAKGGLVLGRRETS